MSSIKGMWKGLSVDTRRKLTRLARNIDPNVQWFWQLDVTCLTLLLDEAQHATRMFKPAEIKAFIPKFEQTIRVKSNGHH